MINLCSIFPVEKLCILSFTSSLHSLHNFFTGMGYNYRNTVINLTIKVK